MFNVYKRMYNVGEGNEGVGYLVNSNDIIEDDFANICMGTNKDFFQGTNHVLFHISVSKREVLPSREPYEREVTISSNQGKELPKELSDILEMRYFKLE